jgi:uncharacterized peroxidase-related enzyme
MNKINIPAKEQLSEETKVIFDQLQKKVGKVPNLYAAIGYSANALKGFLSFEEELSHGAFTAKEREAIALAVSETNSYDYCLAAHTQAALKRGFDIKDTIAIREGEVQDTKLNAVIQLAKNVAENKGDANPKILQNFYTAGYDEAALVELIALIAIRIFTNYVYAITNVPIDFPLAEALPT